MLVTGESVAYGFDDLYYRARAWCMAWMLPESIGKRLRAIEQSVATASVATATVRHNGCGLNRDLT